MIRRGRGLLALVSGVLVTVITSMPVFLVGALATEITDTVPLPSYGIGLAVGTYWAAAALTSAGTEVIGKLLPPSRMAMTALLLAVLSLAGSASWIPSWPWLIVWAGIGGISTGLGHPSSNHLLANRIPATVHGLAFGVKQAAVPLAALVAGVSVPVIALTLGWPFGFLVMAVLGSFALLPLAASGGRSSKVTQPTSRERLSPRLRPPLVLMATMTMFAAGAVNSAVAFSVVGAVERGIDLGLAGVVLAMGSALAALTRIIAGRVVDKGHVSALLLIRISIATCAAGLFLMAIPLQFSYVAGFLLAAGLGWGWPGLVHFFVSHSAPHNAAGATGIVQTGTYIGNTIGPVAMGAVLAAGSSSAAWLMLTATASLAVVLSFFVGRRFRSIGHT